MTFFVPVTVLNSDVVSPGNLRLVSFSVSLGGATLWTAAHEIVIGEPEMLREEDIGFPTIISVICFIISMK